MSERDDGLAGIAAQLLAQLGALFVVHHVQADLHRAGAGNVGDRFGYAFDDFGLFRAGGDGQVDPDEHAAVGRDVDAFDHPEFGDGTPQFGVDHLASAVRMAALRSASESGES